MPGWVPPTALTLLGAIALGLAELIGLLGNAGGRPHAGTSTAPADTRAPDEIVDAYLRERLVDRDAVAAAGLQCKSPSLSALDAEVGEMVSRESAFAVRITTTWGDLVVHNGPPPSVDLDLTVTAAAAGSAAASERHSESWTFRLAAENGWKVCGATKNG